MIDRRGSRDALTAAERLLAEFGSLGAVLAAPVYRLQSMVGAGAAQQLVAMRGVMREALHGRLAERPVIDHLQAAIEALALDLAHARTEIVRGLFLDTRGKLIRNEVLARGSVDEVVIHVREVMARGLELGASALILAHNHPSGDPTPSRADITMTHRLAAAGKMLDMPLYDHLIIARSEHVSMRALNIL